MNHMKVASYKALVKSLNVMFIQRTYVQVEENMKKTHHDHMETLYKFQIIGHRDVGFVIYVLLKEKVNVDISAIFYE